MQPDKSLSAAEVAARLGKCTKWVYQHKRQLPFARELAGSWFYSERGLEQFLAGRDCAISVQELGSQVVNQIPNSISN